jgi:hypothetical protein
VGRSPRRSIGRGLSAQRPDDTVLLYGHLDKQPEMTGWREGLGPWKPVREGDKLYGRGGADDGYAAFASLAAIACCTSRGCPTRAAWCSSRPARRAAAPTCRRTSSTSRRASARPRWWCASTRAAPTTTSSGCTTSLRGLVGATLSVRCSARACTRATPAASWPSSPSGWRGSSCRAWRTSHRPRCARRAAHGDPRGARRAGRGRRGGAGRGRCGEVPLRRGHAPDGGPGPSGPQPHVAPDALGDGRRGPAAARQRGQRAAPEHRAEAQLALASLRRCASRPAVGQGDPGADPPYGAHVHFEGEAAGGWDAPALAPWLEAALEQASQATFGRGDVHMGEGGSIPFMGMLGQEVPPGAVHDHRGAGPREQRPRPQRVPAPAHGRKVTACAHVLTPAGPADPPRPGSTGAGRTNLTSAAGFPMLGAR